MSNAKNVILTDNNYSYIEFRFGRFATVTNRAKNRRELLSNEAAAVLRDELLAKGWVKADEA